MSSRPDTFLLTLPDGTRVRCWTSDARGIRADVGVYGSVILVKDPATEVYARVAPDSVEAPQLRENGRRVG